MSKRFTYEPAASNPMAKLQDAYIVLWDKKYYCRAETRDHAEEICQKHNTTEPTFAPERRQHDFLRGMVDSTCVGMSPHMVVCIKDVARRAYLLGVKDGMELKEGEK